MKKLLLLIAFLSVSLFGSELYIAAGAGYKRPVTEAAKLFEAQSGIKLNMIFGNMQQINEQIKNTDKITLFMGDQKFINKLGIQYDEKVNVGKGILMLVYPKNSTFASVEDIQKASKIAIPDLKKAIYGSAGDEFLINAGYKESLNEKLIVLQTVPQVSAYLVSGDVDAGFINKTDFIGIQDKVGAGLEIDQKLYSPINIICVTLKGKESAESAAFLEFLRGDAAKALFKAQGL